VEFLARPRQTQGHKVHTLLQGYSLQVLQLSAKESVHNDHNCRDVGNYGLKSLIIQCQLKSTLHRNKRHGMPYNCHTFFPHTHVPVAIQKTNSRSLPAPSALLDAQLQRGRPDVVGQPQLPQSSKQACHLVHLVHRKMPNEWHQRIGWLEVAKSLCAHGSRQ